MAMLVGIISDTHGLMRPEALAALRGSDLIIHAGDVGKSDVISQLREIAPTFAVRGNIDLGPETASLPDTETVKVGELSFFVLHDLSELAVRPPPAECAAIVFGHSHLPSVEVRGGVLYLNPGSAGPRRLKLPVTIARVLVSGQHMQPEIVTLDVR